VRLLPWWLLGIALAVTLGSPDLTWGQVIRPGDERPELPEFGKGPPAGQILPAILIPGEQERVKRVASSPRVFVLGYRISGNTVFPESELLSIAEPYTNREVTFEDLLALRDELTLHYVHHGYVTSGAILSDQVSSDGVLELQVTEGVLSDIRIGGEKHFRPSYLRDRVSDEIGQVVDVVDLERKLQLLQQDPRIERLDARLLPRERRGEADLDLTVHEARPYQVGLEFSNHQSPAVGSQHAQVQLLHGNLTGNGDVLDGAYRVSRGLSEIEFGYRIPINSRDTTVGLWYRKSWSEQVEEPFDDLDIESRFATYAVEVEHPVYRSLSSSLYLSASGEYRRSKSYLFGSGFSFSPGVEEGVSEAAIVRLGQEFTHRSRRQVVAARSMVSWGLDALGATHHRGDEPDGQFLAWLGQVQWARRFETLQAKVIARFDVQLTKDALLSFEQFAIGGYSSVRGYRENQLVRDNGLAASIEIRIPLLRRSLGQPLAELAPFYDFGKSWNQDRRTPSLRSLSSAGIGLLVRVSRYASAEVYWAKALRSVPDSSDEWDLQDSGFHFRVRSTF
jgi:hemolysin activation/secretion protein